MYGNNYTKAGSGKWKCTTVKILIQYEQVHYFLVVDFDKLNIYTVKPRSITKIGENELLLMN